MIELTYAIHNEDCITGMAERLAPESVDLCVTSIPFGALFSYSGKNEDVGNNQDGVDLEGSQFGLHMRFFIEQLYRVTAPGSLWAGTSVEDRRVIDRIGHLSRCRAEVLFISFEPLIGAVGMVDLSDIDWAIVGGESGPGYRAMDHDWARELRDQCLAQGVAFFFKQDSGPRTEMSPELDGVRWEQYPDVAVPA